ncbi:hypothetical protein CTI14_44275, partial [Methylobacterium radiotolerans]
AAAGTELDTTRFVERFAYYEVAKEAYLMVRTGETRKSDAVVVADAHFPAWGLGGARGPIFPAPRAEVVAAIRSVLPLDDAPGIDLMTSATARCWMCSASSWAAAGTELDTTRFVERFAYYEVAKEAYLMVRTG